MLSAFVSRMVILLFGTLYPAYASYKAVRTKNVKEYVKWMMYWIVYAFFTCIETFTDIFLSWFPFYYEVKVILVIWLLSPATKGSSTLYRKFVHPMLTRREHEIDEYLNQAKEKGYTTVLQLGSKGMNYATSVIMQTAIKGGGNLVQTLKKSYSLSDLSEPDTQRTQDEIDEITRPQRTQRVLRPRTQSTRSASGGRNMPEMYFPEVDVTQASRTARDAAPNYNYIRSSEDISSGYSSAEPVPVALSRTASLSHATRGATRLRSKRSEAGGNSWEDDGEGDYPFSPSSPPQSPFSNDSSLSSFYAPQDRFRYSFDGEPLYLVEEEEDSAKIVEITEDLPEFSEVFRPIKQEIDAEMEEKYRMFQQWLKSQQNSVKNLSEDFRDTRSESSEDEFHELDEDTSRIIVQTEEEAKAEMPVVVAEEPITCKEEVQEVPKEEIPESVIENSCPTPPPLPGKKSPSHGKGRAPDPPANLPISPPLSADEEDPVKISDKKPSSKKSKLIDYIPGILRPDSAAKPSKSTDKAPKETSI